jgi:hypothetical protein
MIPLSIDQGIGVIPDNPGGGALYGVILPLLGTHVPRPLRYLMPWTILRLALG